MLLNIKWLILQKNRQLKWRILLFTSYDKANKHRKRLMNNFAMAIHSCQMEEVKSGKLDINEVNYLNAFKTCFEYFSIAEVTHLDASKQRY